MNELCKTLTFVAVALVLTGAAFVSTRDRTKTSAEFNDQGKPFFEDFKDPLACTDLEVVEFEPSTATATRFRVMFKDKKWVIPSHYNYPADAKDRLSKTAGGAHGSDQGHDPLRQHRRPGGDGRDRPLGRQGQRPFRDAASASPCATRRRKCSPTSSSARRSRAPTARTVPAMHYVRVPGQKRIYGVNIKAEPSTRFADWIETNLLKVEASQDPPRRFRQLQDSGRPQQSGRGRLMLQRGEKVDDHAEGRDVARGRWTACPPDQELVEDKLRTLTDALGDLKIVGVRPRPPGLKNLDQEDLKLSQLVVACLLQNKGFFLTRQGLFSDQGDVLVSTDEGVVYTLRYGGPIFAEGDELTAGKPDDAEKKDEPRPRKMPPRSRDGTQENRYLMVTVCIRPDR